jgi:methionyl-tRNA formyltransferase
MAALRIVFMGTPDLACFSLEALLQPPEFEVVAAVTQPDRPKGRALKLHPSPVKEIALRKKLPVLQPERARDERFIQALAEIQPEIIAVAAFGQILPKAVLETPKFGCVNVHTSLLPKYRGAAPIQWALLNGDTETGVTIMKMDCGMDTGDIIAQERTPILPSDNSQTLHDRLGRLGAELLVRTIPDYVAGKIHPIPQPSEGVTAAPKIKKQDGHIDWTRPATAIWNQIRAFTPWPGAFTHFTDQPPPHLLKIWEAAVVEASGAAGEVLCADAAGVLVACGVNAIRISALQREGGRRMSAREFLAGHSLKPGQKLA